ncbi:MAG: HAD hydrolase family protein, partial [Victivallales bacterium]|nr:HAD hydrolase family protein [Victivallales bacterium]
FIAVLPPDEARINAIRAALSGYSVIRATSPMDNHTVWLEIFNQNAGKGNSAKWLAHEYLPSKGINVTTVYAIGNDYNDLDMLEFADFGFLAPSAPSSLKERFPVTTQDTDGALAEAVANWKLLKS